MTRAPLHPPPEGRLHDWIVRLSERSYTTIVLIYLASVLLFGILYFGLSWFWSGNGPVPDVQAAPWTGFLNSLFFSTITATSVGYGEFSPEGFSKVVASLQSFLSLLLAAIFVTKPISTKQEQALFAMHRLVFDNSFSSLREGLYVVRHDFEVVLLETEKRDTLAETTWHNLATTYRHMQVLIEDISRVLKSNGGLYTIDKHREILLLEAVERTLERLDAMLDTFDARLIDWRKQEHPMKRLQKSLLTVKVTIERWKRHSPNRLPENFKDVEKKLTELQGVVGVQPLSVKKELGIKNEELRMLL